MEAKEYFDKHYGKGHIELAVNLKDYQSIYDLMQEYAGRQTTSLREENDRLREAIEDALDHWQRGPFRKTKHYTILKQALNMD